jgi:hypothetical protein
MGILHNWYRPEELDRETFRRAKDDFKKILPELEKKADLVGIEGRPKPIAEDYGVMFSVGKLPWFILTCVYPHRHRMRPGATMHSDSVKTYGNPGYDLAVMSCLLVFKHHFGDALKVGSDLDIEKWQPAIDLIDKELGWKSIWRFDEKEADGITDKSLIETKITSCEVTKNA